VAETTAAAADARPARRGWRWAALLLVAFLLGAGAALAVVALLDDEESTEVDSAEVEANRRIARSLFLDGLNKEDWGLLERYAAPTFVAFDLPPGFPQGVAGLKEDETRLREGIPDLEFTIQDTIAEGDKVTVRWTACGKFTGTFRPFGGAFPPQKGNGRIVRWTGTRTFQIRDGKVLATWANIDVFGLLAQVGALPIEIPPLGPCPQQG
jgi:predicted ester cyclase